MYSIENEHCYLSALCFNWVSWNIYFSFVVWCLRILSYPYISLNVFFLWKHWLVLLKISFALLFLYALNDLLRCKEWDGCPCVLVVTLWTLTFKCGHVHEDGQSLIVVVCGWLSLTGWVCCWIGDEDELLCLLWRKCC